MSGQNTERVNGTLEKIHITYGEDLKNGKHPLEGFRHSETHTERQTRRGFGLHTDRQIGRETYGDLVQPGVSSRCVRSVISSRA